jgi:hypothetical protein
MSKRGFIFVCTAFSILLIVLGSFLFSSNLSASRFKSMRSLIQTYIGGRVVNGSNETLTVYDWRRSHLLLPHHISREEVHDVDAIKIDSPSVVLGHFYASGVLKFCDTATITISDSMYQGKPARLYKVNSGGLFCELIQDMRVYPNLNEAIPFKQ